MDAQCVFTLTLALKTVWLPEYSAIRELRDWMNTQDRSLTNMYQALRISVLNVNGHITGNNVQVGGWTSFMTFTSLTFLIWPVTCTKWQFGFVSLICFRLILIRWTNIGTATRSGSQSMPLYLVFPTWCTSCPRILDTVTVWFQYHHTSSLKWKIGLKGSMVRMMSPTQFSSSIFNTSWTIMAYPIPQAFMKLESFLRSLSSLQKVNSKLLSFCELGNHFHKDSCVEWQDDFLAHKNSKRWGQPLGWHNWVSFLFPIVMTANWCAFTFINALVVWEILRILKQTISNYQCMSPKETGS